MCLIILKNVRSRKIIKGTKALIIRLALFFHAPQLVKLFYRLADYFDKP